MKNNKVIVNTYGIIFPGEDPYIYRIILSYADLCDFLGLDFWRPFNNVDDGTYMDFNDWFLDKCGCHADIKCLYDKKMEALSLIEDNDLYWKATDNLESDIMNESDLIQITVGRPDLIMAFILRWAE